MGFQTLEPEIPWNVLELSIRHPVLAHPALVGSCRLRPVYLERCLIQRFPDSHSAQELGLDPVPSKCPSVSYRGASPGLGGCYEDRSLEALSVGI